MVENESARQAGSNDTMLDPELETDGFAVRMLPYLPLQPALMTVRL